MHRSLAAFAALSKRRAGTAIQGLQIGFDAWERLAKLNTEANKSLQQEGLADMSASRSASHFAGWQGWTGQWCNGADKCSGYSRNVYAIGGQSGRELGSLLEQTLLSINQEVSDWVDEVIKSSSIPSSEATAATAKVMTVNAKTVIKGMSKAA